MNVNNFRIPLLFIRLNIFSVLLVVSCVHANELCPQHKNAHGEISIPESFFTKENVEKSINFLNGVVLEDKPAGEWLEVPNAQKVVKGYILRREALKHDHIVTISAFCDFMGKEAYWYE